MNNSTSMCFGNSQNRQALPTFHKFEKCEQSLSLRPQLNRVQKQPLKPLGKPTQAPPRRRKESATERS